MKRELPFIAAFICELALLPLAMFWGLLFHRPALLDLHWNLKDILIGVGAVIPPLVFLIWTLKSKLRPFRAHQHLLDTVLRRMFGHWSSTQLLLISICAGVCEEALFRGAIQASLVDRVGTILALVLASLAFGAVHLITWTYAIIVTFIGIYLGLLWIWTGNILTPMITHAVYDFVALMYFLRVCRPVS